MVVAETYLLAGRWKCPTAYCANTKSNACGTGIKYLYCLDVLSQAFFVVANQRRLAILSSSMRPIDLTQVYKKYKGLWVALVNDNEVVSADKSVRKVVAEAKKSNRYRKNRSTS